MEYVTLVSGLALLQYIAFGILVGKARGRYGVKAPAITGNDIFERYFRVQQNTLELLVVMLPAMWLFAPLRKCRLGCCTGPRLLRGAAGLPAQLRRESSRTQRRLRAQRTADHGNADRRDRRGGTSASAGLSARRRIARQAPVPQVLQGGLHRRVFRRHWAGSAGTSGRSVEASGPAITMSGSMPVSWIDVPDGREIFRRGQLQGLSVPQRDHRLHRALAEGALAHERGAPVVAQRASDDLRARRRAAVDQHDDGPAREQVAGRGVHLESSLGRAAIGPHDDARLRGMRRLR